MVWERRVRSEVILFLGYSALIFILSSIPGKDVPSQISPYSYLIHFLLYLPYGVLSYLALGARRGGAIAILYAASDEIHQYFVPGRTCSLWDFLVDSLGIIVGISAVILWKRLLEVRE